MNEIQLKFLWCHLIGLRFVLTLLPQYGYISEDEFTKSPEIMAGDFLPFISNSTRNSNSSMIFPLYSSGIPFLFMQFLNNTGIFSKVLTPYAILVGPRLWSTFTSFLCDVLVFKLAKIQGCTTKEAYVAIVLFSSSYLVWVFYTRTFTFGLETILYAALLYAVSASSVYDSPDSDRKKDDLLLLGRFKTAFVISGSLLLGIHVSPSFIHLGIFPLIYWIYQPWHLFHSNITGNIKTWLCNIILILLGSIPTYTVLHLSNKCYENGGILHMPNISHFLLFPLRMKTSFEMDSVIGIETKTAELFFQLFVCFGPLIFQIYLSMTEASFRVHKLLWMSFISVISNTILFTSAPVTSSIPMLLPMVIIISKHINMSKCFVTMWFIFNFACFMIFGVLNDAGVLQSLDFLGSITGFIADMSGGDDKVNFTALYYHTPPPPAYLTAWVNDEEHSNVYLDILHIETASTDILHNQLDLLLTEVTTSVMLVIPSSLPCSVMNNLRILYHVELFYQIFPHLQMSDLMNDQITCDQAASQHKDLLDLFIEKFSLYILKVSQPFGYEQGSRSKHEVLKVTFSSYALAQ